MTTATLITLPGILERRRKGEIDLAEFAELLMEWAEDQGNQNLIEAVHDFDAAAENEAEIEAAGERLEAFANLLVLVEERAVSIGDAITSGYIVLYSPVQLAALTPVQLKDFLPGMTYQYARRVGQVNIGTTANPVYEDRYEMTTRITNPYAVAWELKEFKRLIKVAGARGGIFLMTRGIRSWDLGITTTIANYVATFIIPGGMTISSPGNLTVDWGDGTIDTWTTSTPIHTYVVAGSYTIKLKGEIPVGGISFTPLATNLKTTSVIDSGIGDFTSTFEGTGLTGIPAGLFTKCPLITTVAASFRNSAITGSIPADLLASCPAITAVGNLFLGCTGLTGAIPAALFKYNTQVGGFLNCFNGCTGLTGIPAHLFDFNTLATNFQSVFNGCTGLTGAIPADLFKFNTQATNFASTFQSCTGLTGAIPADLFKFNTLSTNFSNVFNGCTGLTGAIPTDLFKYNTAVLNFTSVFINCSGLTGAIPGTLFATCPAVTNFQSAFSGCAGLTGSIPATLFTNNVNATGFVNTFFQCIGLTAIPAGLFANNNAVTSVANVFSGCTSLSGPIPAGLFSGKTVCTAFGSAFLNCNNLTGAIPADLFTGCTAAGVFLATFNGCTKLTAIPTGLFDSCPAITNASQCFKNCSGITSAIPATIFQNSPSITNLGTCFQGCTGLTGAAPTFWVTYAGITSTQCFNGDTQLSNYASIPAGWK